MGLSTGFSLNDWNEWEQENLLGNTPRKRKITHRQLGTGKDIASFLVTSSVTRVAAPGRDSSQGRRLEPIEIGAVGNVL